MKIGDLVQFVSNTSNEFELNNSELKKVYFKKNIEVFNTIVGLLDTSIGTFGTGYPFYSLDVGLNGELPIIDEQLRYNNQLINDAKGNEENRWVCAGCLKENYESMPDLKQICKPCPNMVDNLKPRKIINRLPDLDMWVIVQDGSTSDTSKELTMLLELFNIHTSDIDPIETLNDIYEIKEDIKNNKIPRKFLPIDIHIIEYTKLKNSIMQIPGIMEYSRAQSTIPYLPIHPLSYRKKWQYDDEAYNFIFDFLYSFTLYSNELNINKIINNVRYRLSHEFTIDELINFIYQMASDSTKRRMKTQKIIDNLKEKFSLWSELKFKNIEKVEKNTREDR